MDSRKVRWLVLLRRALVSALGVELLYLVVGNAVLARRVDALAVAAGVRVERTRLRTLFPGDVRAAHVKVASADDGLSLRAERIRGRFGIRTLLGGTTHLTWLAAHDVTLKVADPTSWSTRTASAPSWPVPITRASLLATSPSVGLRIDQLELHARCVELGSVRLKGAMKVESTAFTVSPSGASFEVDAAFDGVSAECGMRPCATRWRGSIAAKRAPPAGPLSIVADAPRPVAVNAVLRGDAVDWGVLLGVGRPMRATNLRAHVGASLQADELQPGSEIFVEMGELDWNASIGAVVPRGARLENLVARLTFEESPPAELRLVVHAAALHLAGSPLGERFTLEATSEIDHVAFGAAPHVDFGAATMTLTRLDPAPPANNGPGARTPATLEGHIEVRDAVWSMATGFGLDASLAATGLDAGMLLDLLDAEPSMRWMLEELENTPFELGFDLGVTRDDLAIENVVFDTPVASAQGAVFWDETVRGALLVERGELALGLVIRGEATFLEPNPSRDWLSRTIGETLP